MIQKEKTHTIWAENVCFFIKRNGRAAHNSAEDVNGSVRKTVNGMEAISLDDMFVENVHDQNPKVIKVNYMELGNIVSTQ